MAQLRVNKVRRVSRLSIEGGPITMGRSSQNAVVLPHTSVSREQCVIELVDGEPLLRDLESRHGTRVNGKKVETAVLFDGDRIGVGPFEITYADSARPRRPGGAGEGPADVESSRRELRDRTDALEQRQQAVQEREEALADRERQLAGRERDLTEREHGLDARESTIAESVDALARGQTELDRRRAERDETVGVLRAELDSLQAVVAARQQELETARLAAAAEERRARELEAELAEAQHQQARLEGELQEAADQLTAREERARQELETRSARLEEAVALGASLKDRIKDLETGQLEAGRRIEHAERALGQFESVAGTLRQLAQRLSAAQERLRNLEAVWTETSEWLEQADKRDITTLRHLIQQRDSASEQLEAAHAERDELIAQIQQQIEALDELTANERRDWETVVRRPQTRSFLSGITRRFAT
ncbi:MAG: FHA domain-containing protein [Planctomycetota bacterium]